MVSSTEVFQSYAAYYDLLYKDKKYDDEVNYICNLLQRMNVSVNQLLELGCGSGKHGYLLAQKGYCVHGIEQSEEMIKQVKHIDGFTCEQGDIRQFKYPKTVDAVLALFHVISYQVKNNDINAVFKNVHHHLKKEGLFIFDIWYSPAVLTQGAQVRLKEANTNTLKISRIANPVSFPNENRIDVNYTVFIQNQQENYYHSFKETHSMRHFSLPELDQIAMYNGFERVAAEAFLTKQNPSEETWGVCIVLRKV